ncbi:MAG: DNA-binding NtrC family response regulator [Desulforhopalus sp.]|jgi:DNA-binding NtrC family response regulator
MLPETQILIADREHCDIFSKDSFADLSFECFFTTVDNTSDLRISLIEISPQILIIDMGFGGDEEDTSLLESIQLEFPRLSILPIIPAGKPHLARALFNLDLFFFLHKPLEPTETAAALKRAYENITPASSTATPATVKKKHLPFHGMIGASKPMSQLFEMICKVAEDDLATILIRGESGTGKEMVAKAIHTQSARKDNNFVPVNCAAIPDDLLESELFGYTKGAFTGANNNKPGRIQYADKGTLFLDEIGDMKSSLQAKLLRVIQEKEFEPVGAFKSIPVNTRILAATHCDLEALVKEGKFREDLYYRLSVIPIRIPSLRERKEDLPLLIATFLEKFTKNRGRQPFTFSPRANAAIICYDWQGNVRELENLIQHMAVLYSGKQVQLSDLPEKIQEVEIPDNFMDNYTVDDPSNIEGVKPDQISQSQDISWDSGQIDFNELINDFETQLIVQALKQTDGNKKEAAKLLNLKRTTLLEKIKKKAIDGLWEQ